MEGVALFAQHFLYFFPLPQGQGSFLPVFMILFHQAGLHRFDHAKTDNIHCS
jgi:hypothetical protein